MSRQLSDLPRPRKPAGWLDPAPLDAPMRDGAGSKTKLRKVLRTHVADKLDQADADWLIDQAYRIAQLVASGQRDTLNADVRKSLQQLAKAATAAGAKLAALRSEPDALRFLLSTVQLAALSPKAKPRLPRRVLQQLDPKHRGADFPLIAADLLQALQDCCAEASATVVVDKRARATEDAGKAFATLVVGVYVKRIGAPPEGEWFAGFLQTIADQFGWATGAGGKVLPKVLRAKRTPTL